MSENKRTWVALIHIEGVQFETGTLQSMIRALETPDSIAPILIQLLPSC